MIGSYYNGFCPEEREACGRWRRALLRTGELRPYAACVICGVVGGIIDAHREDYSQPFRLEDDIPACYRCHMLIHVRLSFPDAWDRYRDEIRSGLRYEPLVTRDYGAFGAQTISRTTAVARTQHATPPRLWLDDIHEGRLCPAGRSPGHTSGGEPTRRTDVAQLPFPQETRDRLARVRGVLTARRPAEDA